MQNFKSIGQFKDGRARVQGMNDKYGYIDEYGEKIVDTIYNYASDYSDGVAVVNLSGKYGVIDTDGNYVVVPSYDAIYNFNEGYAVVRLNGLNGIINTKGQEILPCEYEYIGRVNNGRAKVAKEGESVNTINISDFIGESRRYDRMYNALYEGIMHNVSRMSKNL